MVGVSNVRTINSCTLSLEMEVCGEGRGGRKAGEGGREGRREEQTVKSEGGREGDAGR